MAGYKRFSGSASTPRIGDLAETPRSRDRTAARSRAKTASSRNDRYAWPRERGQGALARTAGRYVRAAGIAIKKERERLAAESERKRAAEAAQAAAARRAARAAAARPPPAAPPPAAAAAAGRAKPQGRAASRPAPAAEQVPRPPPLVGFLVAIVATCLALLNVDTVTSGHDEDSSPARARRRSSSVVAILLTNWQHAKERRAGEADEEALGPRAAAHAAGRFMRSAAKDVLTLLGDRLARDRRVRACCASSSTSAFRSRCQHHGGPRLRR